MSPRYAPNLAAAPTGIMGLHQALKARLVTVAQSYGTFTTKSGATRAPAVIDGWLPPKAGADDEQYPFVIVRPRQGADSEQSAEQNATAAVKIVVGTFSDTDDGWFDVANLIDAIRADLNEAPALEGTPFEQTGPLQWEIPEEQPRPEWIGTITTNWTIPRATRVDAQTTTEG